MVEHHFEDKKSRNKDLIFFIIAIQSIYWAKPSPITSEDK